MPPTFSAAWSRWVGMPDQFIEQRILRPLKMNDTGWYVPQEKVARAQPFPERGFSRTAGARFHAASDLLGGGHGLVSTAGTPPLRADAGQWRRTLTAWVLGPKIAYMAADHVLSRHREGPEPLPVPYGLAWGWYAHRRRWPHGHGGRLTGAYAGTYFWIDPKEALVPVFMMQEVTRRNHYRGLVRNMVSGHHPVTRSRSCAAMHLRQRLQPCSRFSTPVNA